MKSSFKLALLAGALVSIQAVGGCAQYLSRHDRIEFGAGNSKAHNTSVHMIDPWPAHAFRRHIPTPGVKAEAAMTRYRTGQSKLAHTPNASPVLINGTTVSANTK